jgi:hypothetical protein
MRNFKFLLMAALFVVAISSCKKAVIEHEENYPHAQVQTQTSVVTNWIGSGSGYEAVVSVPFITADVNNSGLVMCYVQEGSTWIALPITLSAGSWIEHFVFFTEVGLVTFLVYDDDGATPAPGSRTVKIVAVSNTGLIQNPNVDYLNYEEVKSTFTLVD